MFTYAEAEAVLAKLYSATGELQRGAFRARLKTLKKVGIPLGSHPGKGKKIKYGYEQLYQWALCLELAQLGVDPTVVARLIKEQWAVDLHLCFRMAEASPNLLSEDDPRDFYVMVHTELMSANWHHREGAFNEKFPGLLDFTPFDLTECDANIELRRLRGDGRRAFILNFSETVRLIRQAIMDLGMADRLQDHLRPSATRSSGVDVVIDRWDIGANEIRITRVEPLDMDRIPDEIPEER